MSGKKKINNVGTLQEKRGFSLIEKFGPMKGGFSLVELVVVIAIVGILVMLGTPKFMGYVERAELARIQHDVKIMEDKMAEDSINGVKDFATWDDNAKDLGLLVLADLLYETEGKAKNVAKPRTKYGDVASSGDVLSEVEVTSDYKIMPESMSKKIKTNLPGTFYTNIDGKVYYEHDKPLTNVKEEVVIRCEAPEPLDYDFDYISGTIVKYNGTAQHLVIPPAFEVDGVCWPVRIIGRGAFMQGGYRTIVIPEGVQIIEEDAFKENKLESVIIPHGVGSIGPGAFAGNNLGGGSSGGSGGSGSLGGRVVVIKSNPSNISIGIGAFSGNGPSGNTEATPQFRPATDRDLQVSFDKSTGAITDYKGSDTVVVIPPTIMIDGVECPVKSIKKGAYQGRGLITVVLPEGLERIEDYAFSGNQLIGITIPQSVNYIGNYAFAFNELEKVGNIVGPKTKGTIKTIIMKDIEQFNKVNRYGDILENDKKVDLMEVSGHEIKTKLMDHIFVTSHGNIVIDIMDEDRSEIGNNGFSDNEIQALIDNGYIPISSPEDLDAIRSNNFHTFGKGTKWAGEYRDLPIGLSGNYIQVSDIDMSNVEKFKPLGAIFKGVYDGGRFIIENLTINENRDLVALFSQTERGSEIRNIGLKDANINGGQYYTGGLVGRNNGAIKNSYTSGVINGRSHVGGLVGYNAGRTESSYSVASVNGVSNVGGLLGYNSSSGNNNAAINVINSYFIGSVKGDASVGGIVGYNFQGQIEKSYSSGTVISKNQLRVGGIAGEMYIGGTKDSYYNKDMTSRSYGGTGKTTEQMKEQVTYKNWDFDNIWQISPGQYPTLQWQN